MTDYKQVAIRYLCLNKKRTILTIFGVALSTMILFAFLNSIVSLYITERKETRSEVKYEAVVFCESESVAQTISKEEHIVDYKIVPTREIMPMEEGCAVLLNFDHPFLMRGYLEDMEAAYPLEYQITRLGSYYFAEDNGGFLMVIGLMVLFVAYIFAIFGVAVVRNSIQLISLEQIRDYGVLRCIGSTQKQLKEIVFYMSFLLEISGIVLGIGLGFLLYLVIATKAKLEIGFHAIGIPFILVAFLFDLYFVIRENCKFVNKLTPVAAVRGEFKINKRQLKARKTGLIGKALGIEGEYASKSLLRNPDRLWKAVGAMSMGIAMVTVSISVCGAIYRYLTEDMSQYGRYQLCELVTAEPAIGNRRYREGGFSKEVLEKLEKSSKVEEKFFYEAYLYTADYLELYEHMTQENLQDSQMGRSMQSSMERYQKEPENEKLQTYYEMMFAEANLLAYEEDDYANLEKALVAGTLDVSERGIVLVNGACEYGPAPEYLNYVWKEYTITNYQLGDEIEFVDPQKLNERMKERLEGVELWEEDGETFAFYNYMKTLKSCCEELRREGFTQTYIIEGILEKDLNKSVSYGQVSFVIPLEECLRRTGYEKEQMKGRMYHIKGHKADSILREVYEMDFYADKTYLEVLITLGTVWDVFVGVMLFTLFVVFVNLLNIINTTASDLYLRRREFAQLRVLGMSKKRLIFTVLLEGIITAFLADVIGIALGYAIVKISIDFINQGFYVPFEFSYGACAIMLILSTVVICLTVYVPIKNMKINMAEELLASGE